MSDLGMTQKKAQELADLRPIGEIVDIVEAARAKANPAGFAVQAVTNGWGVPEAPAARAGLLAVLEADARAAAAAVPPPKRKGPYARRAGETIEQMSERLKRSKRETKAKPKK